MLHRHTKRTGALMALLSGLISLVGPLASAAGKFCGDGKSGGKKPAVSQMKEREASPGPSSVQSTPVASPVTVVAAPRRAPGAPAVKEAATRL